MDWQQHHIEMSSPAYGNARFLKWYALHATQGKVDKSPIEKPIKKVYLQAALHADELPGMLAIHYLMPRLLELARQGALNCDVIIVPYANPIGLAQWVGGVQIGRFALDGHGNFNRAWPDLAALVHHHKLWQPTGSPHADSQSFRQALKMAVDGLPTEDENGELRKALLSLSVTADYVFDLHCDSHAMMHLYTNYRFEKHAVKLAQALGISVLLLEENISASPFDHANSSPWWRMGKLDDRAKNLPAPCFACTVELRGKGDIDTRYAKEDAAGILAFMAAEGLIKDDQSPPLSAAPPLLTTYLDAIAYHRAPKSGLVVYHVALGKWVKKGDHIADIIDVTGQGRTKDRLPIHAQNDGLVFTMTASHLVRKGMVLVKIVGKMRFNQPGQPAALSD